MRPRKCDGVDFCFGGLSFFVQVEHIAFEHRLGLVPVTEASVVVAISSEHRAEAMEAVRWAVEELKKSVPIWKKEVYAQEEGQTAQWKANPECRRSASK